MNSTQLKSEFNPENYSTQLNSNQVSTLLPARRASLLLASPLGRASVAYISGSYFLLLFGAVAVLASNPVDCVYDDGGDMDPKVAFLDIFEEVQGLA